MHITKPRFGVRADLTRWLSALLLVAMLAAALPVLAQDTPTAVPTDGPPPEGPATTVNGVVMSGAEFQDRVRLTRFLYSYTIRETLRTLLTRGASPEDAMRAVQQFFNVEIGRLTVPDMLADAVLDTMEEDLLLAELAAAQGVEVSDDDVDAQLRAYVGQPVVSEDDEATQEAIPDYVALMIEEAGARTGVSADSVRAFFRAQALRNAWMTEINGPLPTEWPVLSARHILVETEEQANDILARLEAGEDFAALAEELSIDTGSGVQGGELAPAIAETYVGPFADAIRDAEVGVVVGPVQSEFGYHIIEVTDRTVQPLEGDARSTLLRARNMAFRAWLDEQMTEATIERSSEWPAMVPNQPNGPALLQSMVAEL